MAQFGIFAENIRAYVVGDPQVFQKMAKVPISIGFKQQDGSYFNRYFTVLLFKGMIDKANDIKKGDRITVSGKIEVNRYVRPSDQSEFINWNILASELDCGDGSMPADYVPSNNEEDVPF